MPPIKFQLSWISGLGAMAAILDIGTERSILAILNLHVATMPSITFQLNQTYGSGRHVEYVKS